MRIISFILAMAILSLTALPCTDSTSEKNTEHEHSHDSTMSTNTHSHPDGTPDDCPPFCSCECCGTPVVISPIKLITEIIEPNFEELSFYYSSIYTYDFAKGIWHPPTLS